MGCTIYYNQTGLVDKESPKSMAIPKTSFKPPVIDTTISLLDDLDLTGTAPRVAHIMNDSMPVTSWYKVLDILSEHLFDEYENFIFSTRG